MVREHLNSELTRLMSIDGSGWAWYFPLHDGTWSVRIAIRQNRVGPKKKACESTSTLDFYLKMLKETPILADLLRGGQLQSDNLRTTSNWSYSASDTRDPIYELPAMQGALSTRYSNPAFTSP